MIFYILLVDTMSCVCYKSPSCMFTCLKNNKLGTLSFATR